MADSEEEASRPEDLKLRSLRPRYVKADHGLYVSLLTKDITSHEPSQNIAISGAYGSGKSSVLEGLLTELDAKSVGAIQVSLATLNQSRESLLEVSGEATLTAALEKEVVKRLLYSAKPSQIPRSRFNRIGGFRPWPAAGLAAVASALVTGAAQTFGVSLPMEQLVTAQDWRAWSGPALDLVSVGALAFGGQAALSSFRLSQIAVGPATLSLDDKDGNYFDHFLDEIIYFFQRTKMRVVLFEDLDRFNDSGIFLALRELNNLLNSSQQVDQRVTFVHAIRDSLFVQTIEAPDDEAARVGLPDAHARHGADSAASDRAKFFDLIVPVVPFISHEVAADLLLSALGDLPDQLMPSRPLVALAGRHFTDMRVILSIRNEFEVFAAELLAKSAVRGLSPDQLFAMVVYKHLHLDDFERIRTGESLLDSAVDRIRGTVADLLAALDKAIAEVDDAMDNAESLDRRVASAGERLLTQFDACLRVFGWGPVQSVTTNGSKPFARADVATREFWTAVAGAAEPTLQLQSANGPREIPAADVKTFLGQDRNPKVWIRSELQRDGQRLTRLTEARSWLRNASFSDLLSGPFPTVRIGDEHAWTLIGEACREVLRNDLTFELVRGGYLDQNFALYTTKFHGTILSADARTYLMQYVDRHRSEPLFALSGADVDEILHRLGSTFLLDPSALNVSVVDRLVEAPDGPLPALLETVGQAEDFLLTYLTNGRLGEDLLRRLASQRADILDLIAGASTLSDAERRMDLSIGLSALSGELAYAVSEHTADVLAQELDSLPVLEERVERDVASAIADLLASNGLKVADLSRVAEPLLTELASSGGFVISRSNLEAITQRPGRVGLDTVGGLDDGLGRHLLASMIDYLAAVRESPSASVVDQADHLDEVVRAIVDNDPGDLAAALGLLADGVIYDDLSGAPVAAYTELVRAGAITVSRANVTQYIDTVGALDAVLAARLTEARAIQVAENGADGVEESARKKLATLIVASDELDGATKVQLVVSLNTSTTLDVSALGLVDPELAANLLAEGEVADDLATFTVLATGPWPVFEACASRSSAFGSIASELVFTDDLLARALGSKGIIDAIKKSLLGMFETFEPVLGASSAVAWMTTSSRLRVPLTTGQLTVLAQAGARSEQLINYMKSGQARLTATDLVPILAHCGKPYAGLATANGATFTVPYANDFRQVLQTLKNGGVVKDFHKKRMRDLFEVRMAG